MFGDRLMFEAIKASTYDSRKHKRPKTSIRINAPKKWVPPFDFGYEGLVCLEIKDDSVLTTGCRKVICTECSEEVKNGPQRCPANGDLYKRSDTIIRNIKEYHNEGEYGNEKIPNETIKTHQKECVLKKLKKDKVLTMVHPSFLVKVEIDEDDWDCAARTNMTEDHHDNSPGTVLQCETGDINFGAKGVYETKVDVKTCSSSHSNTIKYLKVLRNKHPIIECNLEDYVEMDMTKKISRKPTFYTRNLGGVQTFNSVDLILWPKIGKLPVIFDTNIHSKEIVSD